MFLVDITPMITWFFSQTFNIATGVFDILETFSFGGFTLLQFLLAVGLLSVILQMIIATPRQSEKHVVVPLKKNKGGK